jgi:uncharacterized protein YjbI with pentapeptide repeats
MKDGRLSRPQWALTAVAEVFLTGLESGDRWRQRRTSVPAGAVLRFGAELLLQGKFPRAGKALIWARVGSRWTVREILPSRPVAKAVQRRLEADPQRTLRGLELASAVVRATHWLHLARWKLDFASLDLRAMTLDGTPSDFLERADFSASSLTEMRFFGMLELALFDRATLRETTFIGCALWGASFQEASLEDVVIASGPAPQCNFAGARISHCTISDVEFQESSFTGAEVRDVVFERCDFEGVEFGDAVWENVDFIECSHVDGAPGDSGKRTTLGAKPLSLVRSGGSPGGPAQVTVRYAQALSLGRPPLGYRLQTLARELYVWIALGTGYHRVRREQAGDPNFPIPNLLPRSRLLHAAKTLLGVNTRGKTPSVSELVYRLLTPVFQERHPAMRQTLPELVLVDGERPLAHYVEFGDRSYIVIGFGMEVTAIRLARYCIAWLVPETVRYMDRWPASRDTEAMRVALAESLREFGRSTGEIGGLGRIQVSGLRDSQATHLAMTFLAFVLGHELAHFLQAGDGAPGGASPEEIEMRADVIAAEALKGEHELDGDAMLVEEIGQMTPADVRAAYLSHLGPRGVRELRRLSDEEIDPRSEAFMAGLSRFSRGDWHAAAVAAIIFITRAPTRSLSGDQLEERVAAVTRAAFGEQVAAALESEMAEEGSVLNLLREVLLRDSARAS